VFDEIAINEALSDRGYKRMKRFTYRALWSKPEVEHFLYLEFHGTPKHLLTARFGFRNLPAELFSLRSIRSYGGELYRLVRQRHDERFDCAMNFSFGRLRSPVRRWSLNTPDFSGSELAARVKSEIEDLLLPRIQGVREPSVFHALLLSDVEPFPWVACNGAIRAAQVVAIGRQLGMEATQIRAELRPRERWIRVGLHKGCEPEYYIERVLEDWDAQMCGVRS
jgi:hypothetical protein